MIRVTISYPKDDGDSDHGRVLVSNNALEVAQFMKEALTGWCVDDDLGIVIERVRPSS